MPPPLPRRLVLVLGLLGDPPVVDRPAVLANSSVVLPRAAASPARMCSASLIPGQGSPITTRRDRRGEPKMATLGSGRAYWSAGRTLEGETPGPFEVVPDQVLLGVDAHDPVSPHMSPGMVKRLAQVVGQAPPRASWAAVMGRPPPSRRLEADAEEAGSGSSNGTLAFHTAWPAWFALDSSSTTRNTRPNRSTR